MVIRAATVGSASFDFCRLVKPFEQIPHSGAWYLMLWCREARVTLIVAFWLENGDHQGANV